MKKVLFVATVVQKHIMVFHIPYLKWFKENGYETHVCAKNDYDNKIDCKIPFCDKYYDLPFESSPYKVKNIKVYNKLKEIIDENNYEIIHCHTPMGGVLARLAGRDARRKGTKIIYTAHGFHFFRGASIKNWLLYYPVERLLARYTDVLITINKEDYARAQTFKANKVVYISGVGLPTEKFTNIKVDRKRKRAECDFPETSVVVLSVGELNKNKNHETVIKAISKLNNPNIYYVICGSGNRRKYLQELSMSLGLKNQISFLGYRYDIDEIYQAADIFAFPSFREGLPMSLMEAMASGLPVICSKIRGNIDLIEDSKGGKLIDPYDIDGFAKAIAIFAANKNLREITGCNNLIAIKKFDIEIIIQGMKKIYEEVSI